MLNEVVEQARKPLQIGVVLFYWWTALWKLNSDSFDAANSCAAHFTVGILEMLAPFLVAPVSVIAPPMTIVVEVALPLALLLPRWRWFALLSLIAPHEPCPSTSTC